MNGLSHRAHFERLDELLTDQPRLWRANPFMEHRLAWETRYPELSTWLRTQTPPDSDLRHWQAPEPFPTLVRQTQALCQIAPLPTRSLEINPFHAVDIPGRKWDQIGAFAACLDFASPPAHWLDWCSGKGHLGRLLGRHGTPYLCLERDDALIAQGQRLTQRLGLAGEHRQLDVMTSPLPLVPDPRGAAVALHACGDLHLRLMQWACESGCPRLAIAPCCYNRMAAAAYEPLSVPARHSALVLSRQDLRLVMAETVTAGARVRRQHDLAMARRLAFDLLQREIRGDDNYLPTPSLSPVWLQRPFAEYCAHLAALKGLPALPAQHWEHLEQQGWQRLAEVRRLEVVRNLFRRPLELWLLLDRVLFLESQGYVVRLGEFCSYALTPRNLLIQAERYPTP